MLRRKALLDLNVDHGGIVGGGVEEVGSQAIEVACGGDRERIMEEREGWVPR